MKNKATVCKYCGEDLTQTEIKKSKRLCFRCADKSTLIPRFIKARDDLRERLGLERMW